MKSMSKHNVELMKMLEDSNNMERKFMGKVAILEENEDDDDGYS